MKTRFLFQGVELSGKTMQYVAKRLLRVEKLVPETSKLEVEVNRNKAGKFRVEVMVDVPKQKLFRSEETSESVEASTDAVVDDIERQITETKDREGSLARRGARSIKKKLTLDKSARF
ncbi:MAG: ribosome-associated translation inhibitor RaiA [Candidatus Moraniibacteriota bacterium]|nr:MAG: ribosome-associated translation inhibitor RaiA [Candidatus Moranbacteria bacterium]